MKLTENKLLRAIGEADEQMVEKAAPKLLPEDLETLRDFVPEQTEAPAPQRGRIIRRITEIGVLCAAVAFCVFAGIGLVKLKRSAAGSNLRKKGGIDEARAFLVSFAEIVKKGDTQEILAESLIGKMCELIPDTYDDPPEEFAEWYTEQWSKSFRIEDGEDEYDDIVSCRQMISDRIEYICMKYTKNGEPEKAEEFRKAEQPYLDLFESIEEAYCFDIICGTEEEPVSDDIEVFCIGGKWYAEPLDYIIPGLSEEARAELEEYRKQNEKSEEEPTETEAEAASPLNFEVREDGAYVLNCSKDAESVRIPERYQGVPVVGIEYRAFSDCEKLESITFPAQLSDIGYDAFSGTMWLEQKRAENPLVIVNGILIDGRTAKGDITIPDGVKTIGAGAFMGSAARSVTMQSGLEEIGESAFQDSTALAEISIPESVSVIGTWAFEATPWLSAKKNEDPCVVVNHILIDGSACSGAVTIPDGVTRIGKMAFSPDVAENTKLTSVIIPKGVTIIGESAFMYCSALESVVIPDSVTEIEYSAFDSCSSLKAVLIPDGVKKLGDCVFMYCKNLTDITVSETVSDFGQNVFYSTPWLAQKQSENPMVVINGIVVDGRACEGDVTIPESVKDIADNAFNEYIESIRGKAGSYAETYAKEKGIPFVAE